MFRSSLTRRGIGRTKCGLENGPYVLEYRAVYDKTRLEYGSLVVLHKTVVTKEDEVLAKLAPFAELNYAAYKTDCRIRFGESALCRLENIWCDSASKPSSCSVNRALFLP